MISINNFKTITIMIVNELKPLLGDNWKEKFVHRDCDPEGYSVGIFEDKVLVLNQTTEDLMDYFYDDLDTNSWINIDLALSIVVGKPLIGCGSINKEYLYKGRFGTRSFPRISKNKEYPNTSILGNNFFVHRLIAAVFVPNPDPEKYTIVNHKDSDRSNFNKENLEWCDYSWNALPENKGGKYHFEALYKRDDGIIFTRQQIGEVYGIKDPSVDRSIRENKTYKGHVWEIYDPALEDYLSRHPLQDDWYQHPTMPNVRANGCGVLEVNGKLRIGTKKEYSRGKGYYKVSIGGRGGKIYYTHRLLAECFFNTVIPDNMVVDHIISTSELDTDNSINNLRIVTYKENSKNCVRESQSVSIYDLFGNEVERFESISNLVHKFGSRAENTGSTLTISGKFIRLESNSIIPQESKKFNYIYYKWSADFVCIGAASFLSCLVNEENKKKAANIASEIRKKYLNTGMPAPDGFYYQQGDPWNMLYDPENKELVKKREEIDWLPRSKRGRNAID